MFVSGAAVGSVATYFVVKEKFQKEAEKECAEMHDFYKKKQEELKEKIISAKVKDLKPEEKSKINQNKPPIGEVVKNIKENGSIDYSTYFSIEELEEDLADVEKDEDILVDVDDQPIVADGAPPVEIIEIEEFEDEEDNFVRNYYILYADGTLANDEIYDEIVYDAKDRFDGLSIIRGFKNSMDDEIHIKVNFSGIKYEILKSAKTYYEATGEKGHPIV